MKLCAHCGKKIRWYHAENRIYFQGAMKVMHDPCAWRFLLAGTQKLRGMQNPVKPGKQP